MSAQAHIIGHVGRDPEMRVTQNGTSVTNFSVAVNKRRRSQEGDDPPPDWYRIAAWGKQAEFADNYIRKGLKVYVAGRQEFSSFTGDDGQERWNVEINANELQILTPRESGPDDDPELPF
jgi:single-strand DNA-binding protein